MVLGEAWGHLYLTNFNILIFGYHSLQVQSMACLIACTIGLDNQDTIQKQLDILLRTYNMRFMRDTIDDMKKGKGTTFTFHMTLPKTYILNMIVWTSTGLWKILERI
jgi:hypothetical protein